MRGERDRVALSIIGLSLVIVGLVGVLLLGHQPGLAWSAEVSALPALNAALNATCAALWSAGWPSAVAASPCTARACWRRVSLSRCSRLYVVYHAVSGSRPFGGQGWIRSVYFPLLVSQSYWPRSWFRSFSTDRLSRALGTV